MCRVQRVAGGRIRKDGPRRAPVDAATLVPVRVMAGERTVVNAEALTTGSGVERGECVEVHRDEITVGNVATVSSLSLLRCRANNSRATYERMWRHHVGESPKKFAFNIKYVEGDGDALEREKKLHYFLKRTCAMKRKCGGKCKGLPRQ